MVNSTSIIALDFFISCHIKLINGYEVVSDSDLAELFEIKVENLHKKVSANIARFPKDFLIRPTENDLLRHNVKKYAFTMSGLFMLAGLLNTCRAINISVALIKMFVETYPDFSYEMILNK